MTELAIIGGRSGLGRRITEHLSISHVLGKPDFDITTDDGRDAIVAELKRVGANVIILNAYDHSSPSAQEATLNRIWTDFEDLPVTIVVISSTARAWAEYVKPGIFRDYCEAKASLSKACLLLGWKSKARILLLEPSSVENMVAWHMKTGQTNETYLTYAEFLELVDWGLQMIRSSQFVSLTRSGLHRADELPKTDPSSLQFNW